MKCDDESDLPIEIDRQFMGCHGKSKNVKSVKECSLSHIHMKGYSASLAIREIQIKTTMRYHFTPVRMAIITKSTNKLFGKVVEKREP